MRFVAYFRVSTKRQGESGLGLEAQRSAVESFVARGGGAIIGEFTEVEHGNRDDRAELAKAIAQAKRAKATLLIAKLDRLSRDTHFVTGLMRAGVDFLACDNPHANKVTITIMAALAEHEREQISARTKAALEAAKARGIKLGSARPDHWTGREDARLNGARRGAERGLPKAHQAISRKAREEYADLLPRIETLHSQGESLRRIAGTLNAEGHRTRRGAEFTAVQVRNILLRAGD